MSLRKKLRWNYLYSSNLERVLLVFLMIYAVIPHLIYKTSILQIVRLFLAEYMIIYSFRLVTKIRLKTVYTKNLGRIILSEKKLLKQSELFPEQGRKLFKQYLAGIIFKRLWEVFLLLPHRIKKQLLMKWDLEYIFAELFLEFGISMKYITSFNSEKVKIRDLEKIYHASPIEIYHKFLSTVKRSEENWMKKQLLSNFMEKFLSVASQTDIKPSEYDLLWIRLSKEYEEITNAIYIDQDDSYYELDHHQLSTISLEDLMTFTSISQEHLVGELSQIKNISSVLDKRVFQINRFLKVVLREQSTTILVDDLEFKKCSYLLVNIPLENMETMEQLNEIKSIDEITTNYDHLLEVNPYYIDPDTEFWGHCSNLQAWYEHNYDTRLIHSNLAFPLLNELCKAGDPQAIRVFKEEVATRFEEGNLTVQLYLLHQGYFDYWTKEEFYTFIQSQPTNKVRQLFPQLLRLKYGYLVLKYMLKKKDKEEKKNIIEWMFFMCTTNAPPENANLFIRLIINIIYKNTDWESGVYVCKVRNLFPEIWNSIVLKLINEGEYERAEIFIHEIDSYYPLSSHALDFLGITYERKRSLINDFIAYRKMIIQNRQDAKVYAECASLHLRRNEYSQSIKMFESALDLDYTQKNIYAPLCWLYVKEGKIRNAKVLFTQLLRLSDDFSDAWNVFRIMWDKAEVKFRNMLTSLLLNNLEKESIAKFLSYALDDDLYELLIKELTEKDPSIDINLD